MSEHQETYKCINCGCTETVDPLADDPLPGETVVIEINPEGRRPPEEVETTACPACGSENWHSETVLSLFETVDASIAEGHDV